MVEDDSQVPKTNKRMTNKTAPPEGEPSSSSGFFTEDMTCDHNMQIGIASPRARSMCLKLLQVAPDSVNVAPLQDSRSAYQSISGFDVMTSKGRQMVLDIIREQQPDVVFLAPVCGPWWIMQNINNQKIVAEKRARYLRFVASVARY